MLNYIKTENLSNDEISKRFKNDMDVSNILTFEQEVNDELIINQKDDKFLLSSLKYDDEIRSSDNILSNVKYETDIEEILDDKWTILSR